MIVVVDSNAFFFTLMLDYPAITTPSEPGEYDVTVSLNEAPESTMRVEIS